MFVFLLRYLNCGLQKFKYSFIDDEECRIQLLFFILLFKCLRKIFSGINMKLIWKKKKFSLLTSFTFHFFRSYQFYFSWYWVHGGLNENIDLLMFLQPTYNIHPNSNWHITSHVLHVLHHFSHSGFRNSTLTWTHRQRKYKSSNTSWY